MKIKRHFRPVFLLLIPLIWACLFGEGSLFECFFISLGGLLSSSAFYYYETKSRKETETLTLQYIRQKLLHDGNVLLSVEETLRLGAQMEHFTKLEGKIANATNNLEGFCRYRPSPEMKNRLAKL